MSELIGTYDPLAVQIQFNATNVTGFHEGTMVSMDRDGDAFKYVVGTKGEVSRCINRNELYTLTVTLQQTSPFNDTFRNAFGGDKIVSAAGSGTVAIGVFTIYDPSSYEQISVSQAWLQSEPTRAWSDVIEPRDWVFTCVGVKIDRNQNISALTAIAGAALDIGTP